MNSLRVHISKILPQLPRRYREPGYYWRRTLLAACLHGHWGHTNSNGLRLQTQRQSKLHSPGQSGSAAGRGKNKVTCTRQEGGATETKTDSHVYVFFLPFFFSVQRPFYITETDLLLDCFWDLPVYNYSRTEENPCVRRWRNPSVLLFEALDCYRVAGIFVQSTDNSYYPQLKSLDSECTHCTVQKNKSVDSAWKPCVKPQNENPDTV